MQEKKKFVPFSFQESQTPFSSLRALDSLSTYLTISSLISNEYSGLISFRTDWFNLLAAQRTLNSLLQHHNSKASILQPSAFFKVQFSHLYMPTGKAITLTLQTFVRKVISHVSWFLIHCLVILFLPRSKHLLILQLQSPSAVILEPKIKSVPVSTFPPSICHKVMGLDDVLLVYTHTCTHTHTHIKYI